MSEERQNQKEALTSFVLSPSPPHGDSSLSHLPRNLLFLWEMRVLGHRAFQAGALVSACSTMENSHREDVLPWGGLGPVYSPGISPQPRGHPRDKGRMWLS